VPACPLCLNSAAGLRGCRLAITFRLRVRFHALDYRSTASDPLDARNGELLHVGRVHPHSPCVGHCCGLDPADSGKKPGSVKTLPLHYHARSNPRKGPRRLSGSQRPGDACMTKPNSCGTCNQSFESDRDLQEHQGSAHSEKRDDRSPDSDLNNNAEGRLERERIA
jgi:hypothetical protein